MQCDGPRKPAACCALRAHRELTVEWAKFRHLLGNDAPSQRELERPRALLDTLCRSRVQGFPQSLAACIYAAAWRIGANSAAAGAFKLTQPRHAGEAYDLEDNAMRCAAREGLA